VSYFDDIEQCDNENPSGVRCHYGVGHTGRCSYTWRPTETQAQLLRSLRACPPDYQRETFTAGGAAVSALQDHGLLRREPVGMGWWRLTLTRYGLEVARQLPR